jgi:hypothetical protein
MKAILKVILCILAGLMIVIPVHAGSFVNGGFEDGTFNGWTQGAGYWNGYWPTNPSDFLPGGTYYNIGYNATNIVTPGADPIVGNLLNRVYNGSYAARINDWSNNNSVSVISQTVTNYTDPFIYFAWAAVLEESHYSNDSDNFTLQLVDNTTSTSLINLTYNSYDNGSIFHPYGYWYYTDWQIEQLDVSALQGHDFTLTLLGSDCPYGGHAGYVYLDGFGAAPPPMTTPEPGTIAMVGSGIVLAAGWVRRRFL